jgi:protein TonB
MLTWLVLGSQGLDRDQAASLYDREIRPHETHLVWYSLRNRLPNVAPAAKSANALPLRAVREFHQQIVVGPKETAGPPQLIRIPEPQVALPKLLPLPSVLAVSPMPPRPAKPFTPPPKQIVPRHEPAAALPEAPKLDSAPRVTALAMSFDSSRPKPLPFVAPAEKQKRSAALELPDAPAIAVPPPVAEMPNLPKEFQAPPKQAKKTEPAVALTDEPPPEPAPAAPQPDLVIAGLNSARLVDIPKLPGAHDAGFSGGPHPRPEGAAAAPNDAKVVVPDLSAHGGERNSEPTLVAGLGPNPRKALLDALRPGSSIAGMTTNGQVHAARVATAPEPRFSGRTTYSMAIQMPNLTSYSGSWLVWFAVREPEGERAPESLRSPVPLRLVDPKYIRTAAEERVQGTVRLFGVIRKDGSVDSVEVLRRLDPRLDAAAAEALTKWKFSPALRDGVPVSVDAVFEVPFRLTPKPVQ